jgi:hypothetical protein
VRAFGRNADVPESAFYFWRRELARRGRRADVSGGTLSQASGHRADAESGTLSQRSPLPPVARSSSQVVSRDSRKPSFLPVRVVDAGGSEAGRGVEILLAEGRIVRVPPGFDRQTLAEVLALLEARPC